MASVDVIRYLRRIGFEGEARADLATLCALHRLHPQAIAFENLDPLTGRRVQLDLDSLQRKLVDSGRGGYCFEHNGLLQAVLREIGFRITPLGARVVWNAPAELPPRTHCLTLVDLDGARYLVDVGFGAMTPTAPLLLAADRKQETSHEPMRLREEHGEYVLEALTEGQWRAMYRFDLHPQLPTDYLMANWYVSTFPDSHFVNRLGVAIVAPGRRYTLRGAEFAVHDLQAGTTRTPIDSALSLRSLLVERFKIHLTDDLVLDAALERAIES